MTPEQLILPLLHREAIVLTSTKRRWHCPLCWKSWTFYGANYVGILQHCARERGLTIRLAIWPNAYRVAPASGSV
jgi:hypothetical protein